MGQYLGIHLFDEKGEEILCTYDNAYSAILMDVSVYWMKGDATRRFSTDGEETAVLVLLGKIALA